MTSYLYIRKRLRLAENIVYSVRYIVLSILVLVLASCASTPTKKPIRHYYTKKPTYTGSHGIKPVRIMRPQADVASELLMYASSLIGTPYRYGGESRANGFDCSGMVQYVYRSALGVSLPRVARDIASAGIPISKNRLKIGDLVFFNTTGRPFSHVGMYIGNGQFIHAPNSRSVIRIDKLNSRYYAQHFIGGRTFFIH